MNNIVTLFRIINTLEGYSYLLLLLIAMPLKYILGCPIAVKIAGMLHGVLFIAFMFLLISASQKKHWSIKENTIFFIASLIPFGTFYTKHMIKEYE